MKKIGILATEHKEIFGVPTKYMQWAEQFGEVVLLMPSMPFQKDIDLLIMQGGADVDPSKYGRKPFFNLSRSNPVLEYFDEQVLPEYIENKTPIFGICRGLQALNVAFDGTLKNIYTHTTNQYDRDELKHYIITEDDQVVKVNSLHHQVVDKLGKDLKVIAFHSNKEGVKKEVIEAIAHRELPICAVQYHPEEIYDKYAIRLVNSLLDN